MKKIFHLSMMGLMLVCLTSCFETLQKVGDGIRNSALPAQIKIVESPDLNNSNIISGNPSSFDFVIEQGLANTLTVRLDGTLLEYVASTDIPRRTEELIAQKKSFYTSADINADNTTMLWKRVIQIHNPLINGIGAGQAIILKFDFIEDSINPKYKGTAEARKSITRTLVREGEPIVSLQVPNKVFRKPNETTHIDVPISWHVKGANDVKVYLDAFSDKMLSNQGGSKTNFEYTENLVDAHRNVHLGKGSIAYKIVAKLNTSDGRTFTKIINRKAEFDASSEIQNQTPVSPCGDTWPQYFRLCRKCYDDEGRLMFSPGERLQPACTLEQAQQAAKAVEPQCTFEELKAGESC